MAENNDFILSEEIKRYANYLTLEIKSKKLRLEVRQEYIDHLEDAVYHYSLTGMSPTEAFRKAVEELGETSKIQTLLGAVHNKDKLPRFVKWVVLGVIVLSLLSSPLFIQSESFYAWYSLIVFTFIPIGVLCFSLYSAYNFLRAFFLRFSALRRMKTYAKNNGHKLTVTSNPYLSLFKKTNTPEIIYETDTQRYIMSVWATVRRKKTLHLTDFGFYSYSQNIGYWLVCGSFGGNSIVSPIGVSLWGGLPKDTKWWYWTHTEIVEAPAEGVRFMPKIEFEKHNSPDKENIYVLLLNPIPFGIDFVEKGVLHKGGDDSKFGDVMIWSPSGFMSYMTGRIMYEKKNFKSEFFK